MAKNRSKVSLQGLLVALFKKAFILLDEISVIVNGRVNHID
jgi:hypothetical protein